MQRLGHWHDNPTPTFNTLQAMNERCEREAGQTMRLSFYRCSVALFAFNLCASDGAMAQALTPFRYESQAQRHCPDDTVVWLDFGRERYYTKGQKRYALGFTGSFVCRSEARNNGFRRSPLGLR